MPNVRSTDLTTCVAHGCTGSSVTGSDLCQGHLRIVNQFQLALSDLPSIYGRLTIARHCWETAGHVEVRSPPTLD